MGYNMEMLYTKDAYQLPGETYFGYMRGAYSQAYKNYHHLLVCNLPNFTEQSLFLSSSMLLLY